MIIDILPILLLVMICIGIKIRNPIKYFNDDYLSIETGKVYRGLLSVVVVLHHLALRTEGGVLFRGFAMVGSLAVAVFFFYSGYGLQKSYIRKKDEYRKGFILKRIPTILIPYIIVTGIYWGLSFVWGNGYSAKTVLVGLVKGAPIVSNSWYIITILLFYVAFWLLMLVCREHYPIMIAGGFVFYVIYAICCAVMGLGSWWYNSAYLAVVGMAWAIYEPKLTEFLKKHFFITPLVWVVFIILFVMKYKVAPYIPFEGAILIFELAVTLFFTLSVILLSAKITIGNPVLNFLGEISLETYLIHGLFIQLFRSKVVNVSNELVWSILVLVCSIFSAYLLHLLFKLILSGYKKLISRA